MKTTNLFMTSMLILSALIFVGWSVKNKAVVENPNEIIVIVKYKTQPTKEKETVLALTTLIENVKRNHTL